MKTYLKSETTTPVFYERGNVQFASMTVVITITGVETFVTQFRLRQF